MPAPPPKFEPGDRIGFPVVTVVTAIASQSITAFCALATLTNASARKIAENIRTAKHLAVSLRVSGFLETVQRNRILHLPFAMCANPANFAHVPQKRGTRPSREHVVSLSSMYRCN